MEGVFVPFFALILFIFKAEQETTYFEYYGREEIFLLKSKTVAKTCVHSWFSSSTYTEMWRTTENNYTQLR